MFERILIATDLGDNAAEALHVGFALARKLDAGVVLLHVTDPPLEPPRWLPLRARVTNLTYEDEKQAAEAARWMLEELIQEEAQDAPPVRAEVRVVSGEPSRAILAMSRELHAGLVVMGTHGRRGIAHAVLGSVAERVVRSAPCPVLTVRPQAGE